MARNGWGFIAVNSAGNAPAGGCRAEACVEMSAGRVFSVYLCGSEQKSVSGAFEKLLLRKCFGAAACAIVHRPGGEAVSAQACGDF